VWPTSQVASSVPLPHSIHEHDHLARWLNHLLSINKKEARFNTGVHGYLSRARGFDSWFWISAHVADLQL
jgi:hypothetical protein